MILKDGIHKALVAEIFTTHVTHPLRGPQTKSEPVFVNLLRSPGIDSQPGGPIRQPYLTYQPARLHRLAESIPGLLERLEIRDTGSGSLVTLISRSMAQNLTAFLAPIPIRVRNEYNDMQIAKSLLRHQITHKTVLKRRKI